VKVLVVNGHSLHKRFDLPKLFRDHAPDASVTMLCSAKYGHSSAKNHTGYDAVYTIEDYEINPDVERIAWHLCKKGVDRIVAGNERDILTSARLRDHFGLPGQKIAEALLFRDKVKMNEFARKNGVSVPESAVLSSVTDAYTFAERTGFPILFKPRRGASSLGIVPISNEGDLVVALDQLFRSSRTNRDSETGYQVEQMIDGDIYSVNGFIMNGAPAVVWPNKVRGSWLGLACRGEPVFDFVMEPEEPEVAELVGFTKDLLSRFGFSDGVFHLEAFKEKCTGRIVLCEVASRSPGLLIADCWKKMFGLDLDEISFLLQAGLGLGYVAKLASEFSPDRRMVPAVGYLSIPCRKGIVARAPKPNFTGVEFEKLVIEGSQYSQADNINSLAVLALVEAQSQVALLEKVEELESWYFNEILWEE
jgi:hypothetical protein